MPAVKILNLGDIVPQYMTKALMAFANIINPDHPSDAVDKLKGILMGQDAFNDLTSFKQGEISEEQFTDRMITRVRQNTGVFIDYETFDRAWNEMNPSYSDFSSRMSDAIKENNADQQVVFISSTNPKDMKHLEEQLKRNGMKYGVDALGNINNIAGIPLYLTYVAKLTKANLIEQVIREKQPSDAHGVKFFDQSAPLPVDIKYVRGVLGETDPIFKFLNEESHKQVAEAVKVANVTTLFWNTKDRQPLSEAMRGDVTYQIPTSKL